MLAYSQVRSQLLYNRLLRDFFAFFADARVALSHFKAKGVNFLDVA